MTADIQVWFGRAFDAVAYAIAVTALVVVLGGLPSFAASLGWLGVKWVLFLVGWAAFGYATFALRPKPPWKHDNPAGNPDVEVVGGRSETRFQAAVQRLPPARFLQLPVDERLPAGVNMFVASLTMLGTSLAMEFVFGI